MFYKNPDKNNVLTLYVCSKKHKIKKTGIHHTKKCVIFLP